MLLGYPEFIINNYNGLSSLLVKILILLFFIGEVKVFEDEDIIVLGAK